MRVALAALALALPGTTAAADEPAPRITVTGSGRATTPPDLATIEYRVIGEGATSDGAVAALVAARKATDAGLASLGQPAPGAREVSVNEVRDKDCPRYGPPQLSSGACAVTGYVASVTMTLRTGAVGKAGTVVGLLGRLGARDPHVTDFALAEPGAAQRRAIAAALVDAKARAEAIAAGAGVSLGRLVSASTGGYAGGDVVVTGSHLRVEPPPPPPPPPPPIAVDLTPRPIETQAQVTVAYEIAR